MYKHKPHLISAVLYVLIGCALIIGSALILFPSQAHAGSEEGFQCISAHHKEIKLGFEISPVPLDLKKKNRKLVGLGSYIVNAHGGCNDCHTTPPYALGQDPFQGEAEQINVEGYMAGGTAFDPFIARNLTPCDNGGLEWTFDEFVLTMRTGADLEDDELPPGNTPLLQVMPWPIYGKMTTCDLRAVYEFLRAIPPINCDGTQP